MRERRSLSPIPTFAGTGRTPDQVSQESPPEDATGSPGPTPITASSFSVTLTIPTATVRRWHAHAVAADLGEVDVLAVALTLHPDAQPTSSYTAEEGETEVTLELSAVTLSALQDRAGGSSVSQAVATLIDALADHVAA